MVATIQVYWRPKPRTYTRRKKKKTPEQKRAEWAKNKRGVRANQTDESKALERARAQEKARDLEYVMSRVAVDEATGCWNWLGAYRILPNGPRPAVGSNYRAWVDVGIFEEQTGRRVLPGSWLVRSCGNLKCVNPAHGLIHNSAIALAKRRIAYELGEKERSGDRDETVDPAAAAEE